MSYSGESPDRWLSVEGVLHCQCCGRVEREHQWRCLQCHALLCSTGQGKPFRLCHDEAVLACLPEHPWDLVHVLVYGSELNNGRLAPVWLQALTKVSDVQAENALLHQEVW
jgi:hypothetical protein